MIWVMVNNKLKRKRPTLRKMRHRVNNNIHLMCLSDSQKHFLMKEFHYFGTLIVNHLIDQQKIDVTFAQTLKKQL